MRVSLCCATTTTGATGYSSLAVSSTASARCTPLAPIHPWNYVDRIR